MLTFNKMKRNDGKYPLRYSFFFISYVFFASVIMMNVIVAILLDQCPISDSNVTDNCGHEAKF